MPFIPRHRKPKDPLRHAQRAPRVMQPRPACAYPGCGRHGHEIRGDGSLGRCLKADCGCLQHRPAGAFPIIGEDG